MAIELEDALIIDSIQAVDVVIDPFIYARDMMDDKNIEVLVDKLKAGTELDPIEIQRVSGYLGTDDIVVLLVNGGHRLSAYKRFNQLRKKKALQPRFTSYHTTCFLDEVMDYENWKSILAIRSHNSNDEQGLNSRSQDTKKIARGLCAANPDWTIAEIGEKLHRSSSTISGYVSDIIRERQATTKSTIMRLSCLGWTQEQIGELVGKSQDTVSLITKKFDAEQIRNFHKDGKSIEDIANMLSIDIQTVWHFLLNDKTDDEKFEALNEVISGYEVNPCAMDVMNYAGCLPLMGADGYPGQIPGQIIWNMLYFFTDPGDLVVDPMVGGGTTIDACLIMDRKCYGYDKVPSRIDAIENDITGTIPKTKKASMVFLDPPYFIKKGDEYALPDELRTKEGFMEFSTHWVRFAKDVLQDNGYVALLISDYVDYDNPDGSIFSDEYARQFEMEGFKRLYKLSYPLTANQYQAHDVTRARKEKRILIRGRELHVLQQG